MLILRDARIKRYHARIDRVDSGFVLIDLESTHFTHLNGLKVDIAPLKHGDLICFGGKLHFVYLEYDDPVQVRLQHDKLNSATSP